MLANAVTEHRVLTVMQLLNKDPSLAFESVQVPVDVNMRLTSAVEFPLACLRKQITPGYLFAIARGFPVDSLLQDGTTTLLNTAVEASLHRDVSAEISTLLALGAKPQSMPARNALYAIASTAFATPSKSERAATISMLLEAGASFTYDSEFLCPFSLMVTSKCWKEPAAVEPLMKLMVRLFKSGLNLERATGSPAMTPLQRALGIKAGVAVIALVRLGAKTDPASLGGKDLFSSMTANGLGDMVPDAQRAVMDVQIASAARIEASDTASNAAAERSSTPQRTRNRLV